MSVYVTDTHPLIWYATQQRTQLSAKVQRVFAAVEQAEAFIYVPAPVLWEIGLLHKAGRLDLPEPFASLTQKLLAKPGFEVAPLDLEIITEALSYGFNNDPFDAAIAATAKVKDLSLITKDHAITAARVVETFW